MKLIMDNFSKIFVALAFVFMIFVAGCSTSNSNSDNDNVNDNTGNNQLANPASTYCVDNGGKLEIRTDETGGQYGVCISPEGKECEEWALFRDECSFSSLTHVCTEDEKSNKACTREFMPVCGNDEITYSNKCEACSSGNIDSWTQGECVDESTPEGACLSFDGNWLSDSNECEGMSEEMCNALGGEFNSCASACRNNPEAEICTLQCVIVCKFN